MSPLHFGAHREWVAIFIILLWSPLRHGRRLKGATTCVFLRSHLFLVVPLSSPLSSQCFDVRMCESKRSHVFQVRVVLIMYDMRGINSDDELFVYWRAATTTPTSFGSKSPLAFVRTTNTNTVTVHIRSSWSYLHGIPLDLVTLAARQILATYGRLVGWRYAATAP